MPASVRVLVFIGFALAALGACAVTPTIVPRDAAVLPEGNWAANTGGAIAVLFADTYGQESPSGGNRILPGAMQGDVTVRQGLGEGREQAFRGGLAFFGAYAGYEQAYSLLDDDGGLVWFVGGVGGAHLLNDGVLPFVQPYTGFIAGSTEGWLRPEAALRLAAQAGGSSISADNGTYYAYGIGFVSLEPRLRVRLNNFSGYAGLQLGIGAGRCQECFDSVAVEKLYLVAPGAGISYTFDAPKRKSDDVP